MSLTPGQADVWFLPLGGVGEFGSNMACFGHDGAWIAVDCGILIDRDQDAILVPDVRFLAEQGDRFRGLFLTHAHQDHIGAIEHLHRRLRCPLYATAFTAEVIERSLAAAGASGRLDLHVVEPGRSIACGPFEVEYIHLTHSIPEPMALLVRSRAGNLLHTGDWKLDPTPVVGRSYDRARLGSLGRDRVMAMFCDSTNAMVEGHSASEASVRAPLEQVLGEATGRVVVSCFSSNIARMATIAGIAAGLDRDVSLLGASLQKMVAAARSCGYWPVERPCVDARHAALLPREHLLVLATGCQGEPRTGLYRLAHDQHPLLTLEAGDTVVFSARCIPGCEPDVQALEAAFRRKGVRVVNAREAPIHVSGHPARDELEQMLDWVRPNALVPVHGSAAHLDAMANLADDCHVPHVAAFRNGDLVRLSPDGLRRIDTVPARKLKVLGRRLVAA